MLRNSKLQNLFKLHSKVTVYVPATVNVNEEIDNTEYVDRIATNLSKYFGGATSTPALGYWRDINNLIKEKTTIVFAYCNDDSLDKHIDDVITDCEELKYELKQQAIALEINGEMYFI
jgi:hypothetical protein